MSFADHFSGHAGTYAEFRPDYPDALFEHLAGLAPSRRRAWDCATGNGQAAIPLAGHFEEVVATDASEQQIARAAAHPRVHYSVGLAESSRIEESSVDLISVAQSLHWFDRPRFWEEAERVLVPRGVLAVWSYGLVSVSPEVDAVLDRLYHDVVGAYWPAERALVETGYRTVRLPFEEIPAPAFAMEKEWSLPDLAGYLSTWSAVTRYRAATGRDAVEDVLSDLAAAWGREPARGRRVSWDLALRIGRKADRAPRGADRIVS